MRLGATTGPRELRPAAVAARRSRRRSRPLREGVKKSGPLVLPAMCRGGAAAVARACLYYPLGTLLPLRPARLLRRDGAAGQHGGMHGGMRRIRSRSASAAASSSSSSAAAAARQAAAGGGAATAGARWAVGGRGPHARGRGGGRGGGGGGDADTRACGATVGGGPDLVASWTRSPNPSSLVRISSDARSRGSPWPARARAAPPPAPRC